MASYAARLRALYPYRPPSTSIDHLVIGGGVVGLSVAAGLVNTCGKDRTTFLVERRGQLGQETTSRNSEVIHSGIYYPVGSLKSRLCIRGRDMLYERCKALDIAHKKTQKLIVATSNAQVPYLDKLSEHTQHPVFLSEDGPTGPAQNNSIIPTYFLSGDEARDLEPDLSPGVVGALLVTETGIVDSQALVDSLQREMDEPEYLFASNGEEVAVGTAATGEPREPGEGVSMVGTRVVRVDREEKGDGWVVQMESNWEGLAEGERGEVESVRADVVVNAAGLGAVSLMEGIVPPDEMHDMWLVKGNYMSYKGQGVDHVSRLIYPCPGANLDHLGTHLTLDLDGNIRFGPDVESIGDAETYRANPEYWRDRLSPADSPELVEAFARSVQAYLPHVDPAHFSPDYAGIRPNLVSSAQKGFSDFHIRHQPERRGFIELLGFNSPGLTSALAVGEHVASMVRREVHGLPSKTYNLDRLARGWE